MSSLYLCENLKGVRLFEHQGAVIVMWVQSTSSELFLKCPVPIYIYIILYNRHTVIYEEKTNIQLIYVLMHYYQELEGKTIGCIILQPADLMEIW